MTTAYNRNNQELDDHNHRMMQLRKQMAHLKLPRGIANDIKKYYEHIFRRHRGLRRGGYFFEQELPESLRVSVCRVMYKSFIEKVDIFKSVTPNFVRWLLMHLSP